MNKSNSIKLSPLFIMNQSKTKITLDGIEYKEVRNIKVSEYPTIHTFLMYMTNRDFQIKQILIDHIEKSKTMDYVVRENKDMLIKEVSDNSLIHLIHSDFMGLKKQYTMIFKFFVVGFEDKDIYKISSMDQLDGYTDLFIQINGLMMKKVNSNPKIAYYDLLKQEVNKAQGHSTDFESVYTSIMGLAGYTPDQVEAMTLYQFYRLFHRLSVIKNYDTSTLFKTVDYKGKLDIKDWYSPFEEVKDYTETTISKIKEKVGKIN